MNELMLDGLIKFFFVLVTVSCAFLLIRKSFDSMFFIYATQSFFLSVIALLLSVYHHNNVLLAIGLITIVSKVIIIPFIMKKIVHKMNIKRDTSFKFLSPTISILLSMIVILFVYYVFSGILKDVMGSGLFFLGAVLGISVTLIGLIMMATRAKVITKIVGYLIMENGVLMFGLFSPELPLIIEALIIIDLIGIVMLSALMAYGVDSTIKEFHEKLTNLKDIFGDEEK